jgi:hypothetical protein
MTRSRDRKTPEQLQNEIAYFAAELRRTTSADRIERAHIAIRVREQQLTEARRAACGTTRSDQAPHRPRNALQRVAGGDHS